MACVVYHVAIEDLRYVLESRDADVRDLQLHDVMILPTTIGRFTNLQSLVLHFCVLNALPPELADLPLKTLCVDTCVGRYQLPDALQFSTTLRVLAVRGSDLRDWLPRIASLREVRVRNICINYRFIEEDALPKRESIMERCKELRVLSWDYGVPEFVACLPHLTSLTTWNVREGQTRRIPPTVVRLVVHSSEVGLLVDHLHKLEELEVHSCGGLGLLHKIPPSVQMLQVMKCRVALFGERFPLSRIPAVRSLKVSDGYVDGPLRGDTWRSITLENCIASADILTFDGQTHLETLVVRMNVRGLIIPPTMQRLESLDLLCTCITTLPESLVALPALRVLRVTGDGLRQLSADFKHLDTLAIRNCGTIQVLPCTFASRLHHLDLSFTKVQLPPWELSQMETLALPNLLTSVPPGVLSLQHLTTLSSLGCTELTALPDGPVQLPALENLLLQHCVSLTCLPAWVGALPMLVKLDVTECVELQTLPVELGNAARLRKLWVSRTALTALPASLGRLTSLEKLDLSECQGVPEVPDELGGLEIFPVALWRLVRPRFHAKQALLLLILKGGLSAELWCVVHQFL